jgi:hypothetical protein
MRRSRALRSSNVRVFLKFDLTVSSVDIRSPTARAVQLPLGALVSFSQALLSCTCDNDKVRGSSVAWTRPLRV